VPRIGAVGANGVVGGVVLEVLQQRWHGDVRQ